MADNGQFLQPLALRISRLVENLKKKGADNITKEAIQTRLELLDTLWEKYESGYTATSIAAASDAKLKLYLETPLDDTFEIYLEQKTRLRTLLNGVLASDTKSNEKKEVVSEVRQCAALPKIHLPTFSGGYSEWRSFRDLFSSLVGKNESVSDVERLHYLKGCLSGEAVWLVRRIPTTEKSFTRAWEALTRRYENLRLLVRDQLQHLWGLPAVQRESSQQLKALLDGTWDAVEGLSELGRPVDKSADWVVHLTVEKLDRQTRREWERHIEDSTELPSLEKLQKFLETRIHCVEPLEQPRPDDHDQRKRATAKSAGCTRSPPFRNQTATERRNTVATLKLCSNCLGRHTVEACTSVKRCQRCADRHHTLLHDSRETGDTPLSQHAALPRCRTAEVILSTARVIVASPVGAVETVRALIDPGSEVSLVSESLVQRLALPRQSGKIPLLGVGGARSRFTRGRTTLRLASTHSRGQQHQVEALILPELSCYRPRITAGAGRWRFLSGVTLADPRYQEPDTVEILLGADIYNRILQRGVRKGGPSDPVAQETDFGWILTGTVAEEPQPTDARVHHCSVDKELMELLSRFWEQEEVQEEVPLTNLEQSCEDHFQRTHRRAGDGKYVIRLPFREAPQLGDSRGPALRSLRAMHRRFNRNPSLKDAYQRFMFEYENLGHMERLRAQEEGTGYYLPHHGVVKESSTTTKLRVVFNGSMPTATGKSLNDFLLTGPNLLPPLFDVLLRWRRHAVVFTADMEKMFRQIIVHPEDRRWQRIFWGYNNQGKEQSYQLTTLTYGLACAPYLAVRCIRQLATDEARRFPAASVLLMQDVYMDDVLSGASTCSEARALQLELYQLLRAGGFNLRKWTSNQQELMVDSPSQDNKPLQLHSPESPHGVLGLQWLPALDCFQVTVVEKPQAMPATRRTLLSRTAQLFDPMGWLSPVTVTAKITIQALWLLKGDWDTPLPEREERHWQRFTRELPQLDGLRIPRWLHVREPSSAVELHGFADASQAAYAAVVYVRHTDADGYPHVTLVAAKTKVAPLKKVTLPRLELNAAHLLTKLVHHVRTSLSWPDVALHLWTDSQVTLSWIQGHPGQWKTFVANRVAAIQRLLPQASWHHVKGTDNPADCASRSLMPSELPTFSLWWKGPVWLSSAGPWPTPTVVESEEAQEERVRCHHVQQEPVVELQGYTARFSNLTRLHRVTAWCCRWLLPAANRGDAILTAEELQAAKIRLLRAVQRESFADDVKNILQGRPLSSRSRLLRLSPFLDDAGVLRLGGRLKHAGMSFNRTHPYLLPDDSWLARLWATDAHQRALHGGTQLTLATLRQEVWVLRGRALVKSCVNQCVSCTRWRGQSGTQLMGDLPRNRVTPSRPFKISGVDYAGPVLVRTSRGRGQGCSKGYVAVFVCMTTRAVHLELVSDGSTITFLSALRRFTARRGTCSTLHSDRGTAFIGADRELRSLVCASDHNNAQLFTALADQGIQWRFNPPGAPHFGGLWKAAVKSMKHHLIGERRLTFEEWSTLLAGIEACLNSRPLLPLTDDPDDLEVLTPGHFLVGGPLTAIPEAALEGVEPNRLSRWQLVQQIQQHFWRRWSREYLDSLQARGKWYRSQHTIKVGAICLIKNELLPPTRWPLARIEEVHPGTDGLIRVVTLRTAQSRFCRPVTKVVLLPTESEHEHVQATTVTPV